MTENRLFLLDAYALIFRGYYAFIKNPRINSKGMDTSAIMGFMNSLLDVIKKERPSLLAVAFDKAGSESRTALFPEYKANRDATPEAIKIAVPYIQELLKAMHIPIIEMPGIEADDLIGTLAKQAEKEGYTVYMVTPDKDFAQLVSENIFMYRPSRMGNGPEIWGIPEVQEKFGVEQPEQVIDFLGMMGDAIDNIPGLPGVGEKTAKKFLAEFGSMENLLANTDKLKGKMKEKVEESKELGLLSKELARIQLDCPVQFEAEKFRLEQPDTEKTDALFDELEFRRLKQQFDVLFQSINNPDLPAEIVENKTTANKTVSGMQTSLFELGDEENTNTEQTGKKTLYDTPHLYQLINTEKSIDILIQTLCRQTEVCFDTETTGINALEAELVGISFSWQAGSAFYVPFPEDKNETQHLINWFKPFFEDENISKVAQNIKYDLKVLHKYGVEVKGVFFDTMIAHHLINPDMRHNMDILSETYLGYSPEPIENLIGKKGKGQKSMRNVPLEDIKEYAGEDADITWQLKNIFQKRLKETYTEDLFYQLESPLIPVLTDMEISGIKLDTDYLKNLAEELSEEAAKLEQKIYEQAGEKFNLASPKQLGDILFDKLKIGGVKPKKTKTGQYATGEEILSGLAKDYPIVQDILEWRQIVKLQNTYVEALPRQADKTGRVHTVYLQTVVATGRLSSNNPNLQNIPIRTERGQRVRKAFVATDNDHILLAADYSQIELRIIAALSKEPNMIASFKNGEDIHRATAARVFNVPLEEVTREQRSHAKTVNFGIIYGVSAFGLSNQTNLSRSESQELINAYYDTYPQLRKYIQQQIDFAREHGYVQTVLGRRRYLKDINSRNAVVRGGAERNAVNAPIQGSAADIIKIAMINIYQKLREKNMQTKMLLQVHDELVFDVPKTELDEAKSLIRYEMENAFQLDIPLIVDLGEGMNWLEAH